MITQNIGTPHPMIATPNTAEQIRVTMCTCVCVCVCVFVCGGEGGEKWRMREVWREKERGLEGVCVYETEGEGVCMCVRVCVR